jgi:acyl carrier protein
MEILENVKEAVAKEADVNADDIQMDTVFEEMGIDSLDLVAACVTLGKKYKVRVPCMKSVQEIVGFIEENKKV